MKAETSFNDWENGKKGSAKKKARGPVRSVRVEPVVGGGFRTTTDFHPAAGPRDNMDWSNLEVSKDHDSHEDALNHISKMLGGPKMKRHEEDTSDLKVGGEEAEDE